MVLAAIYLLCLPLTLIDQHTPHFSKQNPLNKASSVPILPVTRLTTWAAYRSLEDAEEGDRFLSRVGRNGERREYTDGYQGKPLKTHTTTQIVHDILHTL